MKQRLKKILTTLFPVWSLTLQSIRSRRLIEHQCRLLGLTRTAEDLAEACDNKIVNGIFTGMMLSPDLFPQHLAPKYLGTYEDELSVFVQWCIKQNPDAIVNVGCAEGYYAVGLATRLPITPIFAFDADPKARHATSAHARLNKLDNVNVDGVVSARELDILLGKFSNPLLILDCEGCEKEFIYLKRVNNILHSYLLIELHPNVHENIQKELQFELSNTHQCHLVLPKKNKPIPKNCEKYLSNLHREAVPFLTDERRGQSNRWICAIPLGIDAPLF